MFSLLLKNLISDFNLKGYFKLCKNNLNLHPCLRTSLHIFDQPVKPNLLYGSEIWGIYHPASSKFRNAISLNKIFKNIEAEKKCI